MTSSSRPRTGRQFSWIWTVVILLLLLIRLPSLVQPAGGDQGLYGYAGQRILAGDVMYRDMWDQKPPAIAVVYAVLWRIWPAESMVPAADLAAAGLVAFLLVALGRLRYTTTVGAGAAVIFLLFGDPYLQRLSGIYVRGQCEPFIAAAVIASLVLLAQRVRHRWHLVAAGVALGVAFWLKYNAAAYALPVAVAAWAWRDDTKRVPWADWSWIAAGFLALAAVVIGYFAANGALYDLRLATIDYNLRYSNETYGGWTHVLRYLVTFPIERARVDPIWFLAGVGTLLLLPQAPRKGAVLVVLAWLAAAALSIAINGSRSLPNYFVQANPALALAASAGLATLARRGVGIRIAVAALLVAGLWRVGADEPIRGWRFASMPGLFSNIRFDLQYVRGTIDRDTYLARFQGQKHDALENERLVRHVRASTSPDDSIYVFGFSGGSVCWKSERTSASRFFWSRPVIVGLAAGQPGYGVAGLLEDLQRRRPTLVALQKEEWRSQEFFMSQEPLRTWLETGYELQHETPVFSVWRAKP